MNVGDMNDDEFGIGERWRLTLMVAATVSVVAAIVLVARNDDSIG